MIPYGRQNITQADIDAVLAVLRSDFLTQGPVVPRFEEAIASYSGSKYAVAASNATAALHLACLALDLGPGDVLWTSPNTFVASANCALYCGADIDFVDIDPLTYNMSATELQKKLERVKSSGGKLPKIVIPVHFAGQSCDMEAIAELAKQYHFKIVEDASHAVGGKYKDSHIGSCRYSDISIFSFHPVKIITTGEGGVLTTNDIELRNRLVLLRSHGITRDEELMTSPSHGSWYYEQTELGFNYRLTDIQAGLGLSQLTRIDAMVDRRHSLAAYYDTKLVDLPLDRPHQGKETYSAYHLYVVKLRESKLKKSRKQVFESLRNAGIGVNVHYIPVHLQPFYQNHFGFKQGDYPNAETYYANAISLPLYFDLTREQQDQVIAALKDTLGSS